MICKRTWPTIPGSIITDSSGSINGIAVFQSGSGDKLFFVDNMNNPDVTDFETRQTDVLFFFSGAISSSQVSSSFGAALFGGDLVVSGSITDGVGATYGAGMAKNSLTFDGAGDWQATGTNFFIPFSHNLGSTKLIVQVYRTESPFSYLTSGSTIEINTENFISIIAPNGTKFAGTVNIISMT